MLKLAVLVRPEGKTGEVNAADLCPSAHFVYSLPAMVLPPKKLSRGSKHGLIPSQ